LIVVIPAYKPDEKLLGIINDILTKTPYPVLVVNDGSGEAFDAIFQHIPQGVTLLKHDINRGKGRALNPPVAYILDELPQEDGAVIADADGQHKVEDIRRVVERFYLEKDAMVLGARAFTGKVPLKSRFGNSLTRKVFKAVSGVKLTDTQTGLRAFTRDMLRDILDMKGERYELEMNMLLEFAQRGHRMVEVPIETVYIDDNASSHFNPFKDSLKIYGVIAKFAAASFISWLIDYALVLLITAMTASLNTEISLLISVATARIISSTVNFTLNKRLTFRSNAKTSSALIKYFTLAAVVLGLSYGGIWLLTGVVGIPLAVAKPITDVLLWILNFVVQRAYVFKPKGEENVR
jgi:putative flippase GtrA